MLNKNIEDQRRKFVAADTLEMGDPLNMDYCYERSRQCLHSIGAQTKLAAQKFNGCSALGWVMLVHIPCPRNPGQVVWCLTQPSTGGRGGSRRGRGMGGQNGPQVDADVQ